MKNFSPTNFLPPQLGFPRLFAFARNTLGCFDCRGGMGWNIDRNPGVSWKGKTQPRHKISMGRNGIFYRSMNGWFLMVVFYVGKDYHYTWIPWAITEYFFLEGVLCHVFWDDVGKAEFYWTFYCHQKKHFFVGYKWSCFECFQKGSQWGTFQYILKLF